MIFAAFVLINLANTTLFFLRRYWLFLFGFLAILFAEPVFQKLSDPTLYGKTYNVFGFDRVKTNLAIICIMGLTLFVKSKSSFSAERWRGIGIFIFIVFFFHLINIVYSDNVTNSLVIGIVSILGPAIFYVLLMRLPTELFRDNAKLLLVMFGATLIFLAIGVLMYRNTIKNAIVLDLLYNRTAGGLWLSNISTQILALLFPFIFSNINFRFSKIMKVFLLGGFVVLLVASISRTALVVYSIMVLLVFKNHSKKYLFIFLGVIVLIGVFIFANNVLGIDLYELYAGRFDSNFSFAQTIEEDTRLRLYAESAGLFIENPFIGSGISTFSELNRSGFSNAHNMFINILVERGAIGLTLVLFFLRYWYKTNKKGRKSISDKQTADYNFFRLANIGFIGFVLIGLTGNDLFVNSGFVNGWATYILLFLLAVQVHKNHYLCADDVQSKAISQ